MVQLDIYMFIMMILQLLLIGIWLFGVLNFTDFKLHIHLQMNLRYECISCILCSWLFWINNLVAQTFGIVRFPDIFGA